MQSQQQAERKTRGFQAAYLLHVPKCLWDKSRPRCARPAAALRLHPRATRAPASTAIDLPRDRGAAARTSMFSRATICGPLCGTAAPRGPGQRGHDSNDTAAADLAHRGTRGRRAGDHVSTSTGTSRDERRTSGAMPPIPPIPRRPLLTIKDTAHLRVASRKTLRVRIEGPGLLDLRRRGSELHYLDRRLQRLL